MKINRVIKVLVISDVALFTGFGLIVPIFAIFLTEQIEGGGLKVAGFAAAIYWIVKSLLVVPFGYYLDKNHGEKDDLYFIIFGNLLASLAVLGYVFAYLPWHIYLLQVVYALGLAMNIPGFLAIYTRHIDKDREALNWSIHSSSVGIGTGVAGALGGLVADYFGFEAVFLTAFGLLILSSVLMFLIKKEILPSTKKVKRPPLIKDTYR